jgi:TP901 family phage tail tape measure protein
MATQINAGTVTVNTQQAQANINKLAKSLEMVNPPLGRIDSNFREFEKSLDAATARVVAFTTTTGLIYGMSDALQRVTRDAIEVEAAMTKVQAILKVTDNELASLKTQLFAIANNTGQTFSEASKALEEFARQGLNAEKTLKATEAALIVARLSGANLEETINGLVATVSSFSNELLDYGKVANTLVGIDARFSTSAAGLIEGIKRVGTVASDAGITFEELGSAIAAVRQVTGRSESVIGNGLKTIFTNLQTDKVQKELSKLGVETKTATGQFLPLIQVVDQLAGAFQKLTDAQRADLGLKIAGKYQINTFKALIQSFGAGETSLFDQALQTARNSQDEAIKRNELLNQTTLSSLNRLDNAITQLGASFGDKVTKPLVKGFADAAKTALDTISGVFQDSPIGDFLAGGIVSALKGPGLLLAVVAIGKLTKRITKELGDAIASVSGLNAREKENLTINQAILSALQNENDERVRAVRLATTLEEKQRAINNLISAYYPKASKSTAGSYESLVTPALRKQIMQSPNTPKLAGGYLPNMAGGFMKEQVSIAKGVGGARNTARAVPARINMSRGSTPVIVNTDEHIIRNFKNSGQDAVFNRDMTRSVGGVSNLKKFGKVERVMAGGYVPSARKLATYRSVREYPFIPTIGETYGMNPKKIDFIRGIAENITGLRTNPIIFRDELGGDVSGEFRPKYNSVVLSKKIFANKSDPYSKTYHSPLVTAAHEYGHFIEEAADPELIGIFKKIYKQDTKKSGSLLSSLNKKLGRDYTSGYKKQDYFSESFANTFGYSFLDAPYREYLLKDRSMTNLMQGLIMANIPKNMARGFVPNFNRRSRYREYEDDDDINSLLASIDLPEGYLQNSELSSRAIRKGKSPDSFIRFTADRKNRVINIEDMESHEKGDAFTGFKKIADFSKRNNFDIKTQTLVKQVNRETKGLTGMDLVYTMFPQLKNHDGIAKKTSGEFEFKGRSIKFDTLHSLRSIIGTMSPDEIKSIPIFRNIQDNFAGGYIPNFTKPKMLGRGAYGTFYKLKGNIGKKEFKPVLDRSANIANEYIIAKFLNEKAVLPRGVSAPRVIGSLDRSLAKNRIGKEVIEGDTLGNTNLTGATLIPLRDFLVNSIQRNNPLKALDLHEYNVMLNTKGVEIANRYQPIVEKILKSYNTTYDGKYTDRFEYNSDIRKRGARVIRRMLSSFAKRGGNMSIVDPGLFEYRGMGSLMDLLDSSGAKDNLSSISKDSSYSNIPVPLPLQPQKYSSNYSNISVPLPSQPQKYGDWRDLQIAGGYIPNFAKSQRLGEGMYGTFYKLRGNVGKKKFKLLADNKRIVEEYMYYENLSKPEAEKKAEELINKDYESVATNIENEYSIAKFLNEKAVLPQGVSAPRVIGTLERSLEKNRIGKEIIQGDTLGNINLNYSALNSFRDFIINSIESNNPLKAYDLHNENMMLNPKGIKMANRYKPIVEKILQSYDTINPGKYTDRFEYKSDIRDRKKRVIKRMLSSFAKRGGNISIVDPGSFQYRGVEPLANGYIPNFNTDLDYQSIISELHRLSPSQRLKFAKSNFRKLGKGSSRIAYDIGGRALKLPLNEAGIAQNRVETDPYMFSSFSRPVLPTIFDEGPDDEFLTMQLAQKFNDKKFKNLVGVSLNQLQAELPRLHDPRARVLPFRQFPNEYRSGFHSIVEEGLISDDLHSKNLGIVTEPDYDSLFPGQFTKDRPVILDYGFTQDIADQYYKRRNLGKRFAGGFIPNFAQGRNLTDIVSEATIMKRFQEYYEKGKDYESFYAVANQSAKKAGISEKDFGVFANITSALSPRVPDYIGAQAVQPVFKKYLETRSSNVDDYLDLTFYAPASKGDTDKYRRSMIKQGIIPTDEDLSNYKTQRKISSLGLFGKGVDGKNKGARRVGLSKALAGVPLAKEESNKTRQYQSALLGDMSAFPIDTNVLQSIVPELGEKITPNLERQLISLARKFAKRNKLPYGAAGLQAAIFKGNTKFKDQYTIDAVRDTFSKIGLSKGFVPNFNKTPLPRILGDPKGDRAVVLSSYDALTEALGGGPNYPKKYPGEGAAFLNSGGSDRFIKDLNANLPKDVETIFAPLVGSNLLNGISGNRIVHNEILTKMPELNEYLTKYLMSRKSRGPNKITPVEQGLFELMKVSDGQLSISREVGTTSTGTVTNATKNLGQVFKVYKKAIDKEMGKKYEGSRILTDIVKPLIEPDYFNYHYNSRSALREDRNYSTLSRYIKLDRNNLATKQSPHPLYKYGFEGIGSTFMERDLTSFRDVFTKGLGLSDEQFQSASGAIHNTRTMMGIRFKSGSDIEKMLGLSNYADGFIPNFADYNMSQIIPGYKNTNELYRIDADNTGLLNLINTNPDLFLRLQQQQDKSAKEYPLFFDNDFSPISENYSRPAFATLSGIRKLRKAAGMDISNSNYALQSYIGNQLENKYLQSELGIDLRQGNEKDIFLNEAKNKANQGISTLRAINNRMIRGSGTKLTYDEYSKYVSDGMSAKLAGKNIGASINREEFFGVQRKNYDLLFSGTEEQELSKNNFLKSFYDIEENEDVQKIIRLAKASAPQSPIISKSLLNFRLTNSPLYMRNGKEAGGLYTRAGMNDYIEIRDYFDMSYKDRKERNSSVLLHEIGHLLDLSLNSEFYQKAGFSRDVMLNTIKLDNKKNDKDPFFIFRPDGKEYYEPDQYNNETIADLFRYSFLNTENNPEISKYMEHGMAPRLLKRSIAGILKDYESKSLANGFIPNFAQPQELGAGLYGTFYKLRGKIGKKSFNRYRGTTEDIEREYEIAKFLNEMADLPSGVSAPKIIGNLERSLVKRRIGKEVIEGEELGTVASYRFDEIPILSFIRKSIEKNNPSLLVNDLHGGNVMLNKKGIDIADNYRSVIQRMLSKYSKSDFITRRLRDRLVGRMLSSLARRGGELSIVDPGLFEFSETMANGFIPNFNNPLNQSINREVEALVNLGYPKSMAAGSVKIGTNERLKNKANPMGLGVYNLAQGQFSLGQAIGQHSTQSQSEKFVPNFADPESRRIIIPGETEPKPEVKIIIDGAEDMVDAAKKAGSIIIDSVKKINNPSGKLYYGTSGVRLPQIKRAEDFAQSRRDELARQAKTQSEVAVRYNQSQLASAPESIRKIGVKLPDVGLPQPLGTIPKLQVPQASVPRGLASNYYPARLKEVQNLRMGNSRAVKSSQMLIEQSRARVEAGLLPLQQSPLPDVEDTVIPSNTLPNVSPSVSSKAPLSPPSVPPGPTGSLINPFNPSYVNPQQNIPKNVSPDASDFVKELGSVKYGSDSMVLQEVLEKFKGKVSDDDIKEQLSKFRENESKAFKDLESKTGIFSFGKKVDKTASKLNIAETSDVIQQRKNQISEKRGRALTGAAFGLPFVSGGIISAMGGMEKKEGRLASAGFEAAGTIALGAQFGPLGLAVSGAAAGLQLLTTAAKEFRPNIEELSKKSQELSANNEKQLSSMHRYSEALGQLKSLSEGGSSPALIAQAKNELSQSAALVGGEYSTKFLSASTDEERVNIMQQATASAQRNQAALDTRLLSASIIDKEYTGIGGGIDQVTSSRRNIKSSDISTIASELLKTIDVSKISSGTQEKLKSGKASLNDLGIDTQQVNETLKEVDKFFIDGSKKASDSVLKLVQSMVLMQKTTNDMANAQVESAAAFGRARESLVNLIQSSFASNEIQNSNLISQNQYGIENASNILSNAQQSISPESLIRGKEIIAKTEAESIAAAERKSINSEFSQKALSGVLSKISNAPLSKQMEVNSLVQANLTAPGGFDPTKLASEIEKVVDSDTAKSIQSELLQVNIEMAQKMNETNNKLAIGIQKAEDQTEISKKQLSDSRLLNMLGGYQSDIKGLLKSIKMPEGGFTREAKGLGEPMADGKTANLGEAKMGTAEGEKEAGRRLEILRARAELIKSSLPEKATEYYQDTEPYVYAIGEGKDAEMKRGFRPVTKSREFNPRQRSLEVIEKQAQVLRESQLSSQITLLGQQEVANPLEVLYKGVKGEETKKLLKQQIDKTKEMLPLGQVPQFNQQMSDLVKADIAKFGKPGDTTLTSALAQYQEGTQLVTSLTDSKGAAAKLTAQEIVGDKALPPEFQAQIEAIKSNNDTLTKNSASLESVAKVLENLPQKLEQLQGLTTLQLEDSNLKALLAAKKTDLNVEASNIQKSTEAGLIKENIVNMAQDRYKATEENRMWTPLPSVFGGLGIKPQSLTYGLAGTITDPRSGKRVQNAPDFSTFLETIESSPNKPTSPEGLSKALENFINSRSQEEIGMRYESQTKEQLLTTTKESEAFKQLSTKVEKDPLLFSRNVGTSQANQGKVEEIQKEIKELDRKIEENKAKAETLTGNQVTSTTSVNAPITIVFNDVGNVDMEQVRSTVFETMQQVNRDANQAPPIQRPVTMTA